MSTRQKIADAIRAVGLAGSEYPPASPQAGDAWPQWAGVDILTTGGGCLLDDTEWDIILALPAGDQASTADAVATNLPILLDALAGVGAVSRADPAQMNVANGALIPVLRIRLVTQGGP